MGVRTDLLLMSGSLLRYVLSGILEVCVGYVVRRGRGSSACRFCGDEPQRDAMGGLDIHVRLPV